MVRMHHRFTVENLADHQPLHSRKRYASTSTSTLFAGVGTMHVNTIWTSTRYFRADKLHLSREMKFSRRCRIDTFSLTRTTKSHVKNIWMVMKKWSRHTKRNWMPASDSKMEMNWWCTQMNTDRKGLVQNIWIMLVPNACLFWEKSTAGWLLMVGLFWEKSTAG
jgi:hypothetical protein